MKSDVYYQPAHKVKLISTPKINEYIRHNLEKATN